MAQWEEASVITVRGNVKSAGKFLIEPKEHPHARHLSSA